MQMHSSVTWWDDVLGAEACAEIRRRFDASPDRHAGLTTSGASPRVNRRCLDLELEHPEWRDIRDTIHRCVEECLNDYRNQHPGFAAVSGLTLSDPRLVGYAVGDFFDWHIDTVDASVADRVLAVILYLSTPFGGQTQFMNQGLSVDAKQGRVLVFPASFEYIHRSAPVEFGLKLAAVLFVKHGSASVAGHEDAEL